MGKYRFLIVAACQVGCGGISADKQSSPLSVVDADSGATSGRDESSSDEDVSSTRASEPSTSADVDTEVAVTPTSGDVDASVDTEVAVTPTPGEVDASVPAETSTAPIDPSQPIVDEGGKLAWVVSATGEGHDRGEDIAAFEDGSLLVTGLFGNTNPNIVFGLGEANQTTLTANHDVGDMFITRFNADGTLAFAKNHNLTYPDTRRAIAPLADGSFVVSGNYWGGTVFGRGETNEVATPEEEYGTFVAKHNADGSIAWVTRVTGAGMPSIAAVSDGFVVTGSFTETATFGVGTSAETTLELIAQAPPPDPTDPNEVLEDAKNHFVAKLTSDGSVEWVKRTGGSYWNEYRDIVALPDDSVVLTGTIDDEAVFGPGETSETTLVSEGENDVFVAKYLPDGSLAWATRAGGIGYDGGLSLSPLADQSVVVVGHYTDSAVFGADEANETTLEESGGRAFMAKYGPDGSLTFARSLGSAEVIRAASLADGTTLVTGAFWASATFGAGEPNETTLTAPGERDAFLAKYAPDGRLAWVKQVTSVDLSHEGRGITLTSDAVFVTGYFYQDATFAPGEPEELTLTDTGYGDLFVAKYWL